MANTDSAKIDFRLDRLLGAADSSCSVWFCISDILVTCIALKRVNKKAPSLDRPRDGSFTRHPFKTDLDYALMRLITRYRLSFPACAGLGVFGDAGVAGQSALHGAADAGHERLPPKRLRA